MYVISRRPGFAFLTRVYLQPLGFHLSDGTLYTYLHGNEYEDIAAAWDWNRELHIGTPQEPRPRLSNTTA